MLADASPFPTLVAALLPAFERNDWRAGSHQELSDIEGAICGVLLRLRARLNAIPIINRIPPEILQYIFETTCSDKDSYSGYASCVVREKTSGWPFQLTLTHVCRTWRDAALGTPTLWTRIDYLNDRLLELFLSRSGAAALSLHIEKQRPDALLQTQVDRLKRLDVTLTDRADRTFVPTLLQFRAPALECLTILGRNGCPSPPETVSVVLFEEQVSSLKALALDHIGWWTPGNVFPCLTHLHLSSIVGNADAPDEVSYLTMFFANTPALQYVHVEGITSGALAAGRPKHDEWRASLPSLRALTCSRSYAPGALHLLSSLELPLGVVVRMYGLTCMTPTSAVRPNVLLPPSILSTFTHLDIRANDSDLEVIMDGPTSSCVWLQMSAMHRYGIWEGWLAQLSTMLPLPSVRSLRAATDLPNVVPNLCSQLNASLVELSVYLKAEERDGLGVSDLAEDVPRRVYAALAGDDPSTCVPYLESLKLETFCTDATVLRSPDLVSMAAIRAQQGRPLRSLVVDTGNRSAHCSDSFSRELASVRKHVAGSVELRPGAAHSHFGLPDKFEVAEAERWWDLPDDIKPRLRKSQSTSLSDFEDVD
ncbi:hypothetical protein C8Q70DRAFT_1054029 [Cubamyces menziesii]|nr:hypothetical protein C8Q70DRAFT_1054029 [Cubamyces menziesii]